jgi:2-keto-4-pentenoate hydratase/2-oxohepta-3-ene-1,7-dioic acid hydratase in catechol pathway
MTLWLRFERAGNVEVGTLEGNAVRVHTGDIFQGASATAEVLQVADITWSTPCTPSKLVGLWNNYRAAAAKQGLAIPTEPLYFIKAPNSYLPHGASLHAPRQYAGRVVYEGELGIVVGHRASDVDPAQAEACIFGYTCVNDVTALDLITHDPAFAQWTRAKSFDGFGPFGPVIATGLDARALTVRTLVNGRERQSYRTDDMVFDPAQLVSHISRELTLLPGDIIACGTSLGVGVLKPGSTVQICVDGIGTLENRFEAPALVPRTPSS